MSRSTTKRFTLQHVSKLERTHGGYALRRVHELAAIDPAVIAAINAAGPLDAHDDFVSAAIEAFSNMHTDADKTALVRSICAAKSDINADDALTSIEISRAESGYLLGLAVGLSLGAGTPFALKGGSR